MKRILTTAALILAAFAPTAGHASVDFYMSQCIYPYALNWQLLKMGSNPRGLAQSIANSTLEIAREEKRAGISMEEYNGEI
ncbi:MAG: hypothetical protein GDA52_10020 [Rhodobacteraceae bacterium]|nr:hypothetical protein [Paracoccaceae bacterium]